MTTAKHTKGLILQMALDGLDGSLADVAGIHNLGFGGLSRNAIDGTDFNSPDAAREYIKGLKDAGEVTFDINWDPNHANHKLVTGILQDLENDDAIALWAVKFPPLSQIVTWKFNGIVTNFSVGAALDDRLTASVTIKISKWPDLS